MAAFSVGNSTENKINAAISIEIRSTWGRCPDMKLFCEGEQSLKYKIHRFYCKMHHFKCKIHTYFVRANRSIVGSKRA